MKFVSTRGNSSPLCFSEAVMEGLAPDGGLYVPEEFPNLKNYFDSWEKLSYSELCFEFFKVFTPEIPEENLKEIVFKSYKTFDKESVAELKKLSDKLYVLELFHGPTLAFKDFALQLLGNLYEYLLAKENASINVLGATSGDTGSAAINGLLGKKGVNIFILYPDKRVSPLQERQMTCTGADNVFPIAITGTFDDAQAIVKELFGDLSFKKEFKLSAVNSINLARILAQCVYYIYAWLQFPKDKRANIEFVVPTGNFGNVLAGWMAYKMGMEVAGFKVATNRNDILFKLFNSGVYELGEVSSSHAPSMDIQVSSNFERFIYYLENKDTNKVCEIMSSFAKNKKYVFEKFVKSNFRASRMDDSEIEKTIESVFEKYNYIVDPHTACAFADLDDKKINVVLSTAHAAKFPDLIESLLKEIPVAESLEVLKQKEIKRVMLPANLADVKEYIITNGI